MFTWFQVEGGSLANLTCVVRGSPAAGPARVFWYKDGAVLGLVAVTIGHMIVTITRYYSDRGTSVVRTVRPNIVASSLLIPNFSLADQVVVSFKIMFINI